MPRGSLPCSDRTYKCCWERTPANARTRALASQRTHLIPRLLCSPIRAVQCHSVWQGLARGVGGTGQYHGDLQAKGAAGFSRFSLCTGQVGERSGWRARALESSFVVRDAFKGIHENPSAFRLLVWAQTVASKSRCKSGKRQLARTWSMWAFAWLPFACVHELERVGSLR